MEPIKNVLIFKVALFNHSYLLCESNDVHEDVAFAYNYMLASEYGVKVDKPELVTKEIFEFVARSLGHEIPEPFYKGFPNSVRKLSPNELAFDQALHYIRTYGLGNFMEAGHSILEKAAERKAFEEKTEIKRFKVLTMDEAHIKLQEIIEDLLKSTRPLNNDQYALVYEYIKLYDYKIKNCASKNTAYKLLSWFRDPYYARFIDLPDVIKMVDEINYGHYFRANIKKLNLKNEDRKFITKILDTILEREEPFTDCYEKKALWCGLLHHIHYKPKCDAGRRFVKAMRGGKNYSVYSEFEKYMSEGNIPYAVSVLERGKGTGALLRNLNYILSRCDRSEDVNYVIDKITKSSNGIVLMQLLRDYRTKESGQSRTFTFTKHNRIIAHTETVKEIQHRKSVVREGVKNRVRVKLMILLSRLYSGKLGKVWIDPEMEKIALPIQENTSSSGYGVLPKGSRVKIPNGKKVRAFTYWEKVNDIDLSCFGLMEDGNRIEFSWRTMRHNQSDAITYSGDQTSGYHGGSEYFDIDISKFKEMYPDVTHIIFCNNVYSGIGFNKCVCRAGFMNRDILDSGEVYEPKTVQTSFTVNTDSTFAYLFAIDLQTMEMIWLNIADSNNYTVAGSKDFGFLTKYFDAWETLNFKEFFTWCASEVVTDPREADVIVTDKTPKEPLPEGKEQIRSCDVERVMALMNS